MSGSPWGDVGVQSSRDPREDGEKCDECGRRYLTVYHLPNSVWDQIHERSPAGLLCLLCAEHRAAQKGIFLFWDGVRLSCELSRSIHITSQDIDAVVDDPRIITLAKAAHDAWRMEQKRQTGKALLPWSKKAPFDVRLHVAATLAVIRGLELVERDDHGKEENNHLAV